MNRNHWKQHECCVAMHNSGSHPSGATAGIYSAKDEGQSAYVLLSVSEGPFHFSAHMTPERAELIAAKLAEAAAAARTADALVEAA